MPRSVLVVAPEAGEVELLRTAFVDFEPDAVVRAANSSDAALFMLSAMKQDRALPDVVVVEIHPLRRDGWQLIEALRGAEWAGVKIVAMSTVAPPPQTMRELAALGVHECLVKPAQYADWRGFIARLNMALVIACWGLAIASAYGDGSPAITRRADPPPAIVEPAEPQRRPT